MSTTTTMTTNSVDRAAVRTSSSQPTPSPFPPDPRYEIRPLTTPTDALWTTAITVQSIVYSSPVFSNLRTPSATIFNRWLSKQLPVIESRMSPSWQLSLGVFDKEFKYSTDEARKEGGKFYWDDWPDEETRQRELEKMTLDDLLKRMDFPLVSIVLSYDGFQTFDKKALEEFLSAFREIGPLLGEFEKRDTRDPETRKPTELGQLLRRNATNTRSGYEGEGITKKLTYYLIDEARRGGFKTMQVESIHPGVTHILLNAPSPCSTRVVAKYEVGELEDKDGKPLFKDIKQTMSRVVVDLN